MNLSSTSLRKTLRIALFLAAVLIIYIFRPTQKSDDYEFLVNKPWNYSLLTAPFDIPVKIDSISEQHIRDSLDRHFEPVYFRDTELQQRLISDYSRSLDKLGIAALNPRDKSTVIYLMRQAYDTGIISSDAVSPDNGNIRMIRDNVLISEPLSSFLTMKTAYTMIDSLSLTPGAHRLILISNLAEYLKPNILLDSITTERVKNEAKGKALAPIGVIQRGERIIDRGEVVTPQLYTILQTYRQINADRGKGINANIVYKSLGALLYIIIIMASLYAYFYFFRPGFYHNIRYLTMTVLIITVATLFSFTMVEAFSFGLYMVPFALVPILITVFLDSRTAFFSTIIAILLCTMVSRLPAEFIITQFVAALTALISIKELSKRSQLIRTALLVFILSALIYVCINTMQTGDITTVNTHMFGALAINAVLISFAYVLIFLLEKAFGFISRLTLVELSDINNPILRELSEECPGTFQHVMAVSNLASAAASRIGANVQLVRAGSLYHDIGKISNPAFFTENQHGINPHDALDPKQSARIVIGHVTEGIKRAEKIKLPSQITDFIAQHHGRGKARYFYTTYCNTHPDEQVDEAPFTYPGPNPQSLETSIVMMADAVEAASRSLKDYSTESISALVNRIIDTQIAEGLHNESPISFRDVNDIKSIFISRLVTMYHSRVSYPEAIKPTDNNNQ